MKIEVVDEEIWMVGNIEPGDQIELAKALNETSNFMSPIVVNFCSPGGCCYTALSMIDLFNSYKAGSNEYTFILTGAVHSSAMSVMCVASTLVGSDNVEFGNHDLHQTFDNSVSLSQLKHICKSSEFVQERLTEIILNNSEFTKEEMEGTDLRTLSWKDIKDKFIGHIHTVDLIEFWSGNDGLLG